MNLDVTRVDLKFKPNGWNFLSNEFEIALCDFVTHLSVCVGEGDAEVGHGPEDSDQRLDGVAVDHRTVLFEVFRREAALVDDPRRKNGVKFGDFRQKL